MARTVSVLFFLGLLTAGLYAVFFVLCGYTVPPGYVGVRQIKFGPAQGFSQSGLTPGRYWGDPAEFYSTVYLVPQTVQLIHFQRQHDEKTESLWTTLPPLEIQSADRATIDLDISVLFQFYPAPSADGSDSPHGGPADLLNRLGVSHGKWQEKIRKAADDEVKRACAKILAGDFYKPEEREPAIDEAMTRMNADLAQYGIEVVALLPRRFAYREARIDQAIFLKNLQEQEEQLNEAGSKLAEVQANLEQVEAKLDAGIVTLKVQGDNEARVIRSEGDLYQDQKHAEGDLAVAKARAEVDRLKAAALAQTAGADTYVAKELSPLLGSIKGGVVSQIDPYDLNEWMSKLGATADRSSNATRSVVEAGGAP